MNIKLITLIIIVLALAFGFYYLYNNSISLTQRIRPNQTLPTPTITKNDKPNENVIYFNDTFSSRNLDATNWDTNCPNGTINLKANVINFSTPKSKPFPETDQVCQIRFKTLITGDFDTWVTYSGFNYATDSENNGTPLNITAKIFFTDQIYPQSNFFPPDNYAYILRQNFPGHEYQSDAANEGSYGNMFVKTTKATTGKIRIQRVGTKYNFYYDNGNGWVNYASSVNKLFNGYVYIGLRTETDHPEASIHLTDFHLERTK